MFWGASGTLSQFFPFFSFSCPGLLTYFEFFEPLQISYGTQWNVVRQGCTSCIKINFNDGQVLFLGIHSSFDSLKFTKFCHGFVNISNKIGVMQKVFFVEWYNSLLTSFRAKGICH